MFLPDIEADDAGIELWNQLARLGAALEFHGPAVMAAAVELESVLAGSVDKPGAAGNDV